MTDAGGLHVHFGLGRIGAGLLLPRVISSSHRTVVVQRVRGSRRSDSWNRVEDGDVLELQTERAGSSPRKIGSLSVIRRSRLDESTVREGLKLANLLVFADDLQPLASTIRGANHVTVSVGSGQRQLAQQLLQVAPERPVYLLENEYDAGWGDRGVKLVVDKLCGYWSLTRPNSSPLLRVTCEGFEEVIGPGNPNSPFPFVSSPEWHLVPDQFVKYYHRRKRYLVNGVHMMLALYCYDYLLGLNIPPKAWRHQLLTTLLPSILREPPYEEYLRVFIGAKVLTLMIQHEVELRAILPDLESEEVFASMTEYARGVLRRIKGFVDELQRVLDPKETNKADLKYDEHVSDLKEFVSLNRNVMRRFAVRERPHVRDIDWMIVRTDKLADELSRAIARR